ncbi:MAG: sel1 repeat family protein, partial [Acinetobacter johnsonii]
EAINSIGFMYFNGFYFERDLKKACEYYEKSANLDYGLGAANTANCYYEGWGGIKDKHKYFEYSLKAAEKNYAPSQFNVAVMYKKGEVIDKSMTKAVYWYEKAVENNEPRAAYNLASLYEKGDGVEQNFDLAYAYYTLANEFGLEIARSKLLELESKVVKENIRILKNGEKIQIVIDDPNSKWEIKDEEEGKK